VLLDQVVCCGNCKLIYVNPRIDGKLLIQAYADAADPTFVAQNPERIATFGRVLAAICRRQGIPPSKEKRVLDVGCAGGAFPKAASELGFQVTGVEPSSWLAEFGRREYGLDIRTGILEENMFPPASFDIVTMWDVIEHLTDPQGALKTIRGLLRDDGVLIVNYPDAGSVVARALGFKWPFWLSVHLIYYTRTTMRLQLEKAGFEIVHVGTHWQKLKLSYLLFRASQYISLASILKKAADATGLGKLGATYNMGQTLMVARKRR
jgi:2-polyprenyl-3-methyl-5-hydroxy-6-metoxy-1,4-benzoquinol methylase